MPDTHDARPVWPRRLPSASVAGVMMAMLCGAGMVWLRARLANPLERVYLGEYIGVSVMPDPPTHNVITHKPVDVRRAFKVIMAGDRAATPAMFGPGVTHAPLSMATVERQPAAWRDELRRNVYGGEPLREWLRWPIRGTVALLLLFVPLGIRRDRQHNETARNGKVVRGPKMVSRAEFNRRVKGDGLKVGLVTPLTLGERLSPFAIMRGRGRCLQLEAEYENFHALTIGSPGSGKSQVLAERLQQIEERGSTAVVYDPHMQFTPRFYRPDRGDEIVNMLDARCPSWSPADEIDMSDYGMAEANALAMGTSLFPGKPSDRNWFFTYCSQLIFKHLVVEYQADAHEMAYMMRHADPLIDAAVKGTELEEMMAENAQQQRAGVVAHLTQAAFALRQVPRRDPSRRSHLVLNDWCDKRKGWLFFTNSLKTRDGLRPMQSMMLDWLIMCLISQGERPDLPHVTLVFDEMQTLQKLQQAVVLVTEGRKSLSAFFGVQGRSQLQKLYEEETEALLAGPFTKFLMRQGEPGADEWAARMTGDDDVVRVSENKPGYGAMGSGHRSDSSQRADVPLVKASEFPGLKSRHGYMRYGDYVVPVEVPARIHKMPKIAAGFIRREGVPVKPKPIPSLEELRAQKEAEKQDAAKRRQEERAAAYQAVAQSASPIVLPVEVRFPPDSESAGGDGGDDPMLRELGM